MAIDAANDYHVRAIGDCVAIEPVAIGRPKAHLENVAGGDS